VQFILKVDHCSRSLAEILGENIQVVGPNVCVTKKSASSHSESSVLVEWKDTNKLCHLGPRTGGSGHPLSEFLNTTEVKTHEAMFSSLAWKNVSEMTDFVSRGTRGSVKGINAPLPPEAKKILKI